MPVRKPVFVLVALATSVALGAVACSSEPPTRPDGDLLAARPSGGGGKTTTELKVSALDPDTVPADTTLLIRVLGSGFTAGSQVSWALAGSPTTKVETTGPVTYVSSKELLAPVTVAADAPLTSYDVVVTAAGGKKGIGVELLEVVADLILLPEPGWAVRSEALDVNDDGVIVGKAWDAAGRVHAVRWIPAGDTWSVQALGDGGAVLINDAGHVVRRASDPVTGEAHSFVIAPSGSETDLGPVYVQAIGNSGTLAGSVPTEEDWRYVAWPRSGGGWGLPVDLPELSGYRNSDPNGMSDLDDLAGHVFAPDGMEWAVVWQFTGAGWSTPTLVDRELGGTAFVVNAARQVMGAIWPCRDGSCASRPVVWDRPGGTRRLLADPLYGSTRMRTAWAADMDEAGRVAGWARVQTGRRGASIEHAAVWLSPSATAPLDLGAAHAQWSSSAAAINDRGLVVGAAGDAALGDVRAAAWRLP